MPRRRDLRSIKRRGPQRKPRASVLIVTEGEKTEPYYFAFFKRSLRLSNVAVEICGEECGSDPLSVVGYGETRFLRDKSIDICICVIDRDSHNLRRFEAALSKGEALDAKHRRTFIVAVSDPCIEFWYLLHFQYSRKPYQRSGKRSRAEVAIGELQSHWPEYEKNIDSVGEYLAGRLDDALKNAGRVRADVDLTGEPNPSTDIDLIVSKLMELGEENKR